MTWSASPGLASSITSQSIEAQTRMPTRLGAVTYHVSVSGVFLGVRVGRGVGVMVGEGFVVGVSVGVSAMMAVCVALKIT